MSCARPETDNAGAAGLCMPCQMMRSTKLILLSSKKQGERLTIDFSGLAARQTIEDDEPLGPKLGGYIGTAMVPERAFGPAVGRNNKGHEPVDAKLVGREHGCRFGNTRRSGVVRFDDFESGFRSAEIHDVAVSPQDGQETVRRERRQIARAERIPVEPPFFFV